MREVVLDTETTGLEPEKGHRLVEICGIELDRRLPTGKVFHHLIDPERDVPHEAVMIHGHDGEKLRGQPLFGQIADSLLEFVGNSQLVIHNADFDLKFLNAELARLNYPPFPQERTLDTLALARRRFPGSSCSLNELCRRFNLDLSGRSKHGARIDAELLAKVYLELIGGRQAHFELTAAAADNGTERVESRGERLIRPQPMPERVSQGELAAHARFIAEELEADVIWNWGVAG
ncbi:MAG TPA: DNA polymerase III subunit epsilon [Micropepsaceae bacterium]|nr:DNA polymerase III subunit epsilon [Micropepsaceae bacterium]